MLHKLNMNITIKKLQPPDEFNLAVKPSTKIIDIKRNVALHWNLKMSTQKLLYMGKALINSQTISAYPNIKNGAKIHLVEIKSESFAEQLAKYFKEKGMSDEKANNLGRRVQEKAQARFDTFSWDDIERLSFNLLTHDYPELLESSDELSEESSNESND